MAIMLVKTRNDDDIIADIEETENKITLTNPIRMLMTNQGVGMMPWNPFTRDKAMTIDKDFVLCITNPEDEIRNAYNSKYGTGILLAGNPIPKIS